MRPSAPQTPARVWVRPPSEAYARCLRAGSGPDPDPFRAREQHDGYVEALRRAGSIVEVVPPDDELPDACFVEDVAVIVGDRAVITRPGAPERRAEAARVEAALSGALEIVRLHEPATLDGGDVMRLGDRLLVGRSRRTNDAGIEQLRAFAGEVGIEVVAVDVPSPVLHLKTVCSALDEATAVIDASSIEPDVLRAAGVEPVPVPEPLGANVLMLGDCVLVSASAPRTARMLGERGFRVEAVALDELHRGDGALSCLSLRWAPAGAWST